MFIKIKFKLEREKETTSEMASSSSSSYFFSSCVAMLVFVCVLLVVVPVYSVNYGIDWSQGVNYDTWGSEKTINVGDTLG